MIIFKNTLKRIFRKRTNLIFMLVIPILLNMFILSATRGEVKYNVGILDQDSTSFTKQFIASMKKQYEVKVLKPSDDIKKMVLDKEVDCAFVIKSGFSEGMMNGEDVSAETYEMEGSNAVQPVKAYVSSYISAAKQIANAANGDTDRFNKGMKAYNQKDFSVSYKIFADSSNKNISNAVSSLGYMAFGMLFLLTFSAGLLLEDKLSGVFDRITATPLSQFSYFVQHMLANFLVAAIQIVFLISYLPKLVDISFGTTPNQRLEVIAVCCVFALACVSIGIAISRFSKSVLMSSSLTTLINIPILMLGGCFWPREIMPNYVQRIGDFVPTTWFLKAGETVLDGKGLMAASPELLYLFTFAAILLVLTFTIKTEKL